MKAKEVLEVANAAQERAFAIVACEFVERVYGLICVLEDKDEIERFDMPEDVKDALKSLFDLYEDVDSCEAFTSWVENTVNS